MFTSAETARGMTGCRLNGEIYEGGTLEGKVAHMVKKDDPILLVFENGNWDNVFFSTEE
ncbi:hypothetical protein [Planococcus sp. SSTMD024]|uniref:hypothetical protein n=1 Tax=Planococcus sp. SSTMD024 TaxID=3242163 RepID=UPI00351E936F